MNGHDTLRLRDRIVPLLHLAQRLRPATEEHAGEGAFVVMLGPRGQADRPRGGRGCSGQQEIVIKALDRVGLGRRVRVAGATIMGDGSVVLILDTPPSSRSASPRGAPRALRRGGAGLAMYESHFGLKEKPFRKTPDPRYLFLNEVYEEALEQLLYAVEECDLALLTGEVGSGKTLLVAGARRPPGRSVRGRDDPEPPPVAPPASCAPWPRSSGCASPRFHTTDLLEQIHDRLLELDEAGRAALLIVDEAHLIPSKATFEEIRLLTNFQLDDRNLIAVVLVGQPELRERLRHRAYRALTQRIGAQFHLTPLTAEDTLAYLRHRLTRGRRHRDSSSTSERRPAPPRGFGGPAPGAQPARHRGPHRGDGAREWTEIDDEIVEAVAAVGISWTSRSSTRRGRGTSMGRMSDARKRARQKGAERAIRPKARRRARRSRPPPSLESRCRAGACARRRRPKPWRARRRWSSPRTRRRKARPLPASASSFPPRARPRRSWPAAEASALRRPKRRPSRKPRRRPWKSRPAGGHTRLVLLGARARGADRGRGHRAPRHVLPRPRGVRGGRAARGRRSAASPRSPRCPAPPTSSRASSTCAGASSRSSTSRRSSGLGEVIEDRRAARIVGGHDPGSPHRPAGGRRLAGAEGAGVERSSPRPTRWWKRAATTSAAWPSSRSG